MIVRSPWERVRVSLTSWSPSMTQLSHAEACDINFIVNRYARSGSLPPPTGVPQYGDVTALQGPLLERVLWSTEVINLSLAEAAPPSVTAPSPTEQPTGSPEPV